jgi:uncharacterized protein (DUF1800 family)
MMLRRGCIWLTFFAVLCVGLSGTAIATEAPMGVDDARHFLNRVGFGATPEEIAEFAKLSRKQAVARALQPVSAKPSVDVPPGVSEFIPRSAIREQRAMGDEAKKAYRRELAERNLELRAWWLESMLRTDTPAEALRERMTLFWHNHFVSSISKVRSTALMQVQNQQFRSLALGSFTDLLHAASKDPAMVIYLDAASNRRGSPNENFAREVMELFTLGEGHYREQDIKEGARAYTGWSMDPETGQFKWRPAVHDNEEKVVLGQRGNFDGDDVLDILLRQPATAEFIVAKLWREFVSPEPDMTEVQRIARLWREEGSRNGVPRYELRFALMQLFNSKAFWAKENRGALIKSPVDLVVGTLHTFGLRSVDGRPFALALRQLGQDLFAPPNVKGWPGGDSWVNTNTLLLRKQFLERLLRSEDMNAGRRVEKMNEMSGNKTGSSLQRMYRALEAVHVDADGWTRRAQALHLTPEQVLLAVSADGTSTDDAPMTNTPRERLRVLMLDTTYQVR